MHLRLSSPPDVPSQNHPIGKEWPSSVNYGVVRLSSTTSLTVSDAVSRSCGRLVIEGGKFTAENMQGTLTVSSVENYGGHLVVPKSPGVLVRVFTSITSPNSLSHHITP